MPKSESKVKKSKTQKKKTAMCGGVGSKKSKTHMPIHSTLKSNQCALCHQSLSLMVSQSDSEDDIAEIGLNCGHKFHYNCLKPFMPLKGKCPSPDCKKHI